MTPEERAEQIYPNDWSDGTQSLRLAYIKGCNDRNDEVKHLQQLLYDIITYDDGIWPQLPDDYWEWYCGQAGIKDVLLTPKQ